MAVRAGPSPTFRFGLRATVVLETNRLDNLVKWGRSRTGFKIPPWSERWSEKVESKLLSEPFHGKKAEIKNRCLESHSPVC